MGRSETSPAAPRSDSIVVGLDHLSLFVSDLERSLEFYVNVLGFAHTYAQERDAMRYAEVRAGSCTLELLEWRDASETAGRPEGRSTLDHFALAVSDLDAAAEALRARSVTFLSEPFEIGDLFTGVKGLFIAGPDGEKIELFERLGH